MKKLFSIICLLVSIKALSQPYLPSYNYGNSFQRVSVYSSLIIPYVAPANVVTDSTRAGGLTMNPADNLLYLFNGSTWNKVGASASSIAGTAPIAAVVTGTVTTISFQTVNPFSVPANATSSAATPVGSVVYTVGVTPSTLAQRDANSNISDNNLIDGYQTIATAGGTTTLTVSSPFQTYFTGSTTQTVVLPVASTLVLGQQFEVANNSTGVVTVNSSGANLVQSLAANSYAIFTCILTSGTTAASWSVQYSNSSATTIVGTAPIAAVGTSTVTVSFQTVNPFSVPANATSSAATPVGSVVYTVGVTPSTLAQRDANSNLVSNNVNVSWAFIPTAAATTTLNVTSAGGEWFTGITTQDVLLPVTTTLGVGFQFYINNTSTGIVTVKSSGGTTLQAIGSGGSAIFTTQSTGHTDATDWLYQYTAGSGGSSVSSVVGTAPIAAVGTSTVTVSFQTVNPFSVPANTTSSAATPAGSVVYTVGVTPSTLAQRDANSNISDNNLIDGYQSIATSITTVTLNVASPYQTYFTGSTAQTVNLPLASTLVVGQQFQIVSTSSIITVNVSGGGSTVVTMAAGSSCVFTCILASGSGVSSWAYQYSPTPLAIGGSTTQIQYNNGGVLAGSSTLVLTTANVLTTTNDHLVNGITLGRGSGNVLGNTVFGLSAMSANTSGFDNTIVGYQAGSGITTGFANSIFGYGPQGGAGHFITTGRNNVLIGGYAGTNISNAVWISDGSGNLRFMIPSTGNFLINSTTDNANGIFQTTGGDHTFEDNSGINMMSSALNPMIGSATLSAGTVTVSTTQVNTGDFILLTGISTSTPCATCGTLSVGTITNATSFVINSSINTDTRVVSWIIFHHH